MKVTIPCTIGLGILLLSGCGDQESHVQEAKTGFQNKSTPYWYETFSPFQQDSNGLVDLYQRNANVLLRNPVLPATLEGLWYMDGNPFPDQTVSFVNAFGLDDPNGSFSWRSAYPFHYSWLNTKESHQAIQQARNGKGRFEARFEDCPDDVVAERRRQGMQQPNCSAADREYAALTPNMELFGIKIRIPRELLYYDFYLKGRNPDQDYLVWERRSRVAAPLQDFLEKVGLRPKNDYYRYAFTQIINGQGKVLSSYQQFEHDMATLAQEENIPPSAMIMHVCFDGKSGCSDATIQSRVANDRANPEQIPTNSRTKMPLEPLLRAIQDQFIFF